MRARNARSSAESDAHCRDMGGMSSAPGRTAVTNSQRWDHVGDPRVRPRGAAFWLGPHGLAGAAWNCHGQRRDRGYPTRCSVRCHENRPVAIRSGPSRRRASYLARLRAFLELARPVLALGRPRSRARRCRFSATGAILDGKRSCLVSHPDRPARVTAGAVGRLARPGTCGARSRTLGVTRSARAGDGQEPRLSSRAREPVHGRQQAPSGA
jgi:hypothetical protein